jgi:hypothetical protein
MTRPDYDGTRYGGQAGVLGAQQYANQAPPPGDQPTEDPQQPPVPGAPNPYPTPGGYGGAAAPGTYGAPAAGTYGAPAPGTYGAPAPAPGTYGAPAAGTYGAPAAGTYGAPAPGTYGAPAPGAHAAAPGAHAAVAAPGAHAAPSPGTYGAAAAPGTYGAAAAPPPVAEGAGLMNPVTRAAQQAASTQAATALATGTAATIAAPSAAATIAAPSAATSVAVPAPAAARPGTVYGGPRPAEGGPDLPGRLARLRIGWHSASLRALELMGVSSPGTGLILGADVDQRPVPVRFFRTEPTRVALVGGVWAAQTVTFRALAFGATVIVLTGDPAAWQGFGERATGRTDRVSVLTGERPLRLQGTPQQPVLVVYDLGMAGPSVSVDLGPWQTQLTVLRQLDERGVPALQESHLVMMQRLAFSEAALAATALRLTGESAQLLQQMEDEMLALIGGGADRYVWISPTSVEQRQGGPARR